MVEIRRYNKIPCHTSVPCYWYSSATARNSKQKNSFKAKHFWLRFDSKAWGRCCAVAEGQAVLRWLHEMSKLNDAFRVMICPSNFYPIVNMNLS